MPAVCFPNPDALRLALASGIVPPDVAQESVRAAADESGRIWVDLPGGFPRDALAALGRIGVTRHGPGTGPPTRPYSRWSELLPLRPVPHPAFDRPVLIDLPDADLPRLAAEVRRVRPQPLGVRLVPGTGRGWLLIRDPPLFTVQHLDGSGAEAFAEQAPRVWVRFGWEHPLDRYLAAPAGSVALLRPGRDWEFVPDEPVSWDAESLLLSGRLNGASPADPPREKLPTSLRLRPTDHTGAVESLWVMPGAPAERLRELAADTDERLLGRFRAAVVGQNGVGSLTVIRSIERKGHAPVFIPGVAGFVPHHQHPSVFLPVGYRLTPVVRPVTLAKLLGVAPGTIVWLEQGERGQIIAGRVAEAAFRPVADYITYRAPEACRLSVSAAGHRPFTLARFFVEPDRGPDTHDHRPAAPAPSAGPAVSVDDGWLSRSLGKIAGRLFKGKSGPQPVRKRKPVTPTPPVVPAPRVGEKLSSPDVLLIGNEWSARRAELEQRVLTDLPRLPPADRADVWAELAEVYSALGHPPDAAVCWLNAAWDFDPAPSEWVRGWLRAEAKAARLAADRIDLDAILTVPAPAPAARLSAAFLTWAAAQPSPPADLSADLPRLLALIEAHESDLPARAVWLARVSAARLTDGDVLGLARCRDRVFRRLVDQGPGLDLDAPSFLRFRGGAAGDRFQTARDFLVKVRDLIHRWLNRQGSGRLQWAGLDPEVGCTAAYADLMLGWGLSKLGDRTRSKELEGQAAEVLNRSGGSGVDPGVHRVLYAAFVDRIRTAQDARADRPGLPLEVAVELARLDELGRYAVDKLRAHSGILEPIDRVNPYRGRDLGGFLGTDAVGDRLVRLLARPDLAPDPTDVRAVLRLALAESTAATLPRVVFTLLELAPRLDPNVLSEVIPEAPRAVELMPEWVRMGGEAADVTAVVRRFGGRVLTAACHAAGLFHLTDALRRMAQGVAERCGSADSPVVPAVEESSGRLFRTLRRLGLTDQATAVLAGLDDRAAAGPRELGLAVGWFAVGNEDAGFRILNAARDRLIVRTISDVRLRTAVAIGYATALGHAPPRVALGRLEELFLQLQSITTRGATNRYYTLKPLELIDAVVRAVVSDDFTLGPGVRGWLDDDEYLIRKRVSRDLEAVLAAP